MSSSAFATKLVKGYRRGLSSRLGLWVKTLVQGERGQKGLLAGAIEEAQLLKPLRAELRKQTTEHTDKELCV